MAQPSAGGGGYFLADGVDCCALQVRFPQGRVEGRGDPGGRVSGEPAAVPGQLHRHSGRHLRHVHGAERRAGLQCVTP